MFKKILGVVMLLVAVIGLAIVSVGQDPVMATARFTFGHVELLSGIHFLTALIGLFAIPQLIENLKPEPALETGMEPLHKFSGLLPRLSDFRRIRRAVGIGSVTGTFLGILPGVGGPIAAFISYDYAKKFSKAGDRFGSGEIEGVAAPEAANNAVTGGRE